MELIVELPGSTLTVGTIQGSTGRDGAGQIGKLQFIQIGVTPVYPTKTQRAVLFARYAHLSCNSPPVV